MDETERVPGIIGSSLVKRQLNYFNSSFDWPNLLIFCERYICIYLYNFYLTVVFASLLNMFDTRGKRSTSYTV